MKVTLLVFSLMFCNAVLAQVNFQDGYILKTEFDTIFGQIDSKDYFSNSQYCDFKNKGSETVTRFKPGDIFGYRFTNGKFYITQTIAIEDNKSTIFMEYLIKGKLNIYYYQEKNLMPHYFVSKENVPLQELKYSEGQEVIDGIDVAYQKKQYIGVLNYLTSDCPQIAYKIPELNEPNQTKLIKFAEKYHNLVCTSESCIIYGKKIPHKMYISANAGYQSYFESHFFKINPIFEVNGIIGEFRTYSFTFMFQQAQRLENLYLGLGFSNVIQNDSADAFYRIPLSINYQSSKPGFSPTFSYEFDLNRMFAQAIKAGVIYQTRKISLSLVAGLNTVLIIKPYGASLNFGLMYKIR